MGQAGSAGAGTQNVLFDAAPSCFPSDLAARAQSAPARLRRPGPAATNWVTLALEDQRWVPCRTAGVPRFRLLTHNDQKDLVSDTITVTGEWEPNVTLRCVSSPTLTVCARMTQSVTGARAVLWDQSAIA